jgi:hypothetical protein
LIPAIVARLVVESDYLRAWRCERGLFGERTGRGTQRINQRVHPQLRVMQRLVASMKRVKKNTRASRASMLQPAGKEIFVHVPKGADLFASGTEAISFFSQIQLQGVCVCVCYCLLLFFFFFFSFFFFFGLFFDRPLPFFFSLLPELFIKPTSFSYDYLYIYFLKKNVPILYLLVRCRTLQNDQ